MLTKRDRTAMLKALETTRRTRAANLAIAAEKAGGWEALGKLCAQSPDFLKNLAGPQPQRDIGEKLARRIEFDLGVPQGWLDQRH